MAMVDVTVMGAGIFGLSVAYACARRGATVRIADPRGVGAGSSGGVVGALAPHVPENWNPKKAFQLESLLMAEAFWAEVETKSGQSTGYARQGRVQPLADSKAIAMAEARSATASVLWGGHAVWNVVETGELGDWRPASPTGRCIWDSLSARIAPEAACKALLKASQRAHGLKIAPAADPSGRVVWATGYEGLQDLSARFGRSMGAGVKGQAALLRYDATDRPQIFAGGLHIVPHHDGTVGIGSTTERVFDDPGTTDGQAEELVRRARSVCPALHDATVVRYWAGVRPRARSRAPMLGAWPDRPGHFIANGGFKIGFGMAPKVGEVMADLVLDGQDRIPDGFRVQDCL